MAERISELARKHKHKQFVCPPLPSTWNARLVFEAAVQWRRKGYEGLPPMPWEVAKMPVGWLEDVNLMVQRINYYEDSEGLGR